jgi:hypothetical protein
MGGIMVAYAFTDEKRQNRVSAGYALTQSRDRRYYCQNNQCDAHLYIRQKHGNKSGYFAALPSKSHIIGCEYSAIKKSMVKHFDERSFNFVNALKRMQQVLETHTDTGRKPRTTDAPIPILHETARRHRYTVSDIYIMCKGYPTDRDVNGFTVRNMLFDCRSEDYHRTAPQGFMLVEAMRETYFYNRNELTIFLHTNTSRRHRLQIHVPDHDIFYPFKDALFNNSDKTIVVAGNWTLSETGSSMELCSKKQYMILR